MLLRLARQAIECALTGRQMERVPCEGELAEQRGVFVTLTKRGNLRGCIGQVEANQPVAMAVVHCAIEAATGDPRFQPVTLEELAEIEIELSLLSPRRVARPEEIEIRRHGLLVTRGHRRGLLLPQVALEHGWGVERFLEETCRKAGLERDAWKQPGTTIEVFTADAWSESELHATLEQNETSA
jgi:AmmeMemoRadiSam system protein A